MVKRVTFCWVSLLCASLAYAGERVYAQTPTGARTAVLKYCRLMCEENIGTSNDGWHNKPRLPYRATFEAAMRGDATALHTVFTRWEYHSGDNEFWQGIPWRLLRAAGDARFAAFVRSEPEAERREVLRYLPDLADMDEQQAWEAFFRRHYPQTYVLYKESWPH